MYIYLYNDKCGTHVVCKRATALWPLPLESIAIMTQWYAIWIVEQIQLSLILYSVHIIYPIYQPPCYPYQIKRTIDFITAFMLWGRGRGTASNIGWGVGKRSFMWRYLLILMQTISPSENIKISTQKLQ